MNEGILIGGSDAGRIFLNPRYANRHGLVTGATGTGKTVTLQCLGVGFGVSKASVNAILRRLLMLERGQKVLSWSRKQPAMAHRPLLKRSRTLL
jgi:hypothetical protein